MTDRCKNCKYFHPLKHNFKQGQGFEQSHACNVLLYMDGDGWIQEVTEDSMCEMFTPGISEVANERHKKDPSQ